MTGWTMGRAVAVAAAVVVCGAGAQAQTSTTLLGEVTAPVVREDARFGAVLAARGKVLAIGAPNDLNTSTGEMGGVYVTDFRRYLLTIANPDAQTTSSFGEALAFRGRDVVAGDPLDDTAASGSVDMVRVLRGSPVRPYAEILAIANPNPNLPVPPDTDGFGSEIAIRGRVAAVAAPSVDVANDREGQVYLRRRPLKQSKKDPLVAFETIAPPPLDTSVTVNKQFFGRTVTLAGQLLVVGERMRIKNSPPFEEEARFHAYNLKRKLAAGEARLPNWTLALPTTSTNVAQPRSAAVGPDLAVANAGARGPGGENNFGAVFVVRNASKKTSTVVELAPPAEDAVNGLRFGDALAGNARYLFVGAPGAKGDDGRVYVYARLLNYKLVKVLDYPLAVEAGEEPRFGSAIAPLGKNVAVSAPRARVDGVDDAGRVLLVEGVRPPDLKAAKQGP